MQKMKIVFVTTLLFFIASSITCFISCNKDLCKGLICKNGGICREGLCKCADGFEGANCETKLYQKFLGTYDGTYRCNGGNPVTETIVFTPDSNAKKIKIYNIFLQNIPIIAEVRAAESEKFDIPYQIINGYSYRGNGIIEQSKYITIYIDQVTPTSVASSCVYNATKYTN